MTTTTRQYQDTQVDVKLVLSSLWIAMLFVFAYVDIFGRSAWTWPAPEVARSLA